MIWTAQNFAAFYFPKRLISSTTRVILKENLRAPAYNPEVTEKNKYERWEEEGLFKADRSAKGPAFSIVLPPPNVTGKLHLGHALSSTIQDVIIRRKRSIRQNVLWLPGTDHAGIATQGVVEKFLKSTQNINKHDIGREKFNLEVWKWKEKHGNTICQQLRMLGCSLDWSKQIFTMDQERNNAVNTAFINLFQKSLIYRKKALVNWCNALKSTVSDIEVENVQINGPTDVNLPGYDKPVRFGMMYNFAYKIFDSNEEIVVSTTMPETMLGDTAIAVHPDDKRYTHLKHKKAVHPFRNTQIPIIFDAFVDKDFGSGAVKITPAHSKVDYEVAKHHNLPLLQVISEDGLIQNSHSKFNKMKRYDCRSKLVNDLDKMGLLRSITSHQMTLPTCSRTGDVIDHLPKEQWFLSCSELNKKATEVVERGQLKIEPDKFMKAWLNWTSDNRDWCISRQLWWGHQIPAYKCSIDKEFVWIAAEDEKTAKILASKFLRSLPEHIKAERDTDVLDTWFSSGIYPFSAFGWPDYQKPDLKTFYPLSLMVTGHDILGFWVHRMVILGLELTGKLPFNRVLLHGIICDSKGAKMSKSKGNVIDPIDVIDGISMEGLKNKATEMYKEGILNQGEVQKALAYHKSNFSTTNGIPQCGVDALRFTLLSNDIKSHYVSFDVNQCHANKLFCNKIWQSIKYMQLSFAKLKIIEEEISDQDLTFFDKWILSRLSNMVDKVNNSMDMYDFHLATKAIRTLIYNEFCDVYLETTKPGFESSNPRIGYAHAHTLSAVLNTALRCLAPFMIYISDELIPRIPAFEQNIIIDYHDSKRGFFDFPQSENFKIWQDTELENKVNKVLSIINLARELKGFYGISNKIRPSICVRTNDHSLVSDLTNHSVVVLHLTRCSSIQFNDAFPVHVKAFLDKDTEILVELIGDNVENTILAARTKLEKRIRKLNESLQKLEEKYTSVHYLSTVPEWTQVLDRERLLLKREELKQLQRLI